MVMELAYRLAVSEQPMIRKIRSEVIVLINPVSEPDGRDKQVDWFYRYLKGKTDFDNLPPVSPPYWGYYVFHDNNRDTHQEALQLSKAVSRMFFDYHPTVVHDLHESIPLLQTWNGTGPFNANIDPILLNELFAMSLRRDRRPDVGRACPASGRGASATAGSTSSSIRSASTTTAWAAATRPSATARPRPSSASSGRTRSATSGGPVTSQEWYRPMPPPRKFRWSLRDNTNYMESGCLAILDYTAKNAKEMLRDFYRKGYNSWQKGVKGGPYAFAIPDDQGDRRRVAEMVEPPPRAPHRGLAGDRALQGRRKGSSRPGPTSCGSTSPTGTTPWTCSRPRSSRPTPPMSPTTTCPGPCPSTTASKPSGSTTPRSWTCRLAPLQPGFEVPGAGQRRRARLPAQRHGPGGACSRSAAAWPPSASRSPRKRSNPATRIIRPAPGSWRTRKGSADAVKRAAAELALDFESAAAVPDVARHESKLPRLAVWHTWADTEAVGWIRYVLDREKVPYVYIRDEDIRAGRLQERYDIILFGHNYLDLQDQIQGIDKKYGPMAYTKTKETPSLGVPDASDDITGGIGWAGMANLEKYLDAGGLLITLGNGSAIALEGGLVRDVYRKSGAVFTPGSELKVKFTRPDHPLAYGYAGGDVGLPHRCCPSTTSPGRAGGASSCSGAPSSGRRTGKRRSRTRSRERAKDAKDQAKKDEVKMLVSGAVKGEDELEGRPAILDLPAGKGRVIAFLFNPIHRDLNRSDYRFLWNAILNWNALPPPR